MLGDGRLWAVMGAPLIVATEIRNMTTEKATILLNSEVIAVNQDKLARAGDLIANVSDAQVPYLFPLGWRCWLSFASRVLLV